MVKWKCLVCDYTYDEERGEASDGISPDTMFGELPKSWTCPVCGSSREMFKEEARGES